MTHTKTDAENEEAIKPTTETRAPNLSTEYQREGDARRPAEQLDKDQAPAQDDGGRKTSFTDNA